MYFNLVLYFYKARIISQLPHTMSLHPNILKKIFLGCIFGVIIIVIVHISGLHLQLLSKDFSQFEYPIYGDIFPYVMQLRNKDKPSVEPINSYNYTYLSALDEKCKNDIDLRLVLIVKSALSNFERRAIIRKTWGNDKRFYDVPMRTVFLLGISDEPNDNLQHAIEAENKIHQDIVQANFHDKYYNNTIKTMMGFKWAVTRCNNCKFYVFLDDDMYVSMKNVLRFVRNPSHYPQYVDEYYKMQDSIKNSGRNKQSAGSKLGDSRKLLTIDLDYDLPDDAILYAGHVLDKRPLRHYTSKWYLDLEEYPFNRWPPYIPAGAYILSKEALHLMYYASFFVKHFRFDDIYLAILAKKIGIEPFHNDYFYYSKPNDYKYVVSEHDESKSIQDTFNLWSEQKSLGNA